MRITYKKLHTAVPWFFIKIVHYNQPVCIDRLERRAARAPTKAAVKEARVPREEVTSTTAEGRPVAGHTGDATTGGRRVARTEARAMDRTETSKANSRTVVKRSTRTTTSERGVAALSDTTVDSTGRGVRTTHRRGSRAGTRRDRPSHRAATRRDVRIVHAVALVSRTEKGERLTSRPTSRHRATAIRQVALKVLIMSMLENTIVTVLFLLYRSFKSSSRGDSDSYNTSCKYDSVFLY